MNGSRINGSRIWHDMAPFGCTATLTTRPTPSPPLYLLCLPDLLALSERPLSNKIDRAKEP